MIIKSFSFSRWLSHWVGRCAHAPLPGPLRALSIWLFAKAMKINLDEAEKHWSTYQSIGDFFVRQLRPGLRPVSADAVIHPCDSRIVQLGKVSGDQLVQAKGLSYSLQEFVGSSELASELEDGSYFSYYLCPADYHRVHSPMAGKILSCRHIPGYLYPVNARSLHRRRQLYNINERVVVEYGAEKGKAVVVFVGATNVGQMSMCFDKQIVTNSSVSSMEPSFQRYQPPKNINKGDELGIFHMGSTVVVFYSYACTVAVNSLILGKKVKMGQSILDAVDK